MRCLYGTLAEISAAVGRREEEKEKDRKSKLVVPCFGEVLLFRNSNEKKCNSGWTEDQWLYIIRCTELKRTPKTTSIGLNGRSCLPAFWYPVRAERATPAGVFVLSWNVTGDAMVCCCIPRPTCRGRVLISPVWRAEPGPTVKAVAARYFNLLYSAQNSLCRAREISGKGAGETKQAGLLLCRCGDCPSDNAPAQQGQACQSERVGPKR